MEKLLDTFGADFLTNFLQRSKFSLTIFSSVQYLLRIRNGDIKINSTPRAVPGLQTN